MDVVNLFEVRFEPVDRPGGSFGDATLGPTLGCERLGASVYELEAHSRGWPYHWHHGNEEVLLVLAGRPTLRTPGGERELERGDCVLFRRGPEGAHAFWNDGDEPARVLMLSTRVTPEIVTYPDSGKIGASSRFGRVLVREDAQVDYWDGEA
jgi:uncharacterized cupin superfamily protein